MAVWKYSLNTEEKTTKSLKSGRRLQFSDCFFMCWLVVLLLLIPGFIAQLELAYSSLLLSAVLMLFVCLAYIRYAPSADRWTEKRFSLIAASLLAVMLLFLLLFGRLLLSEPFNDAGTVYYSCAEVVKSGHISTSIDEHACCAWYTGTSNNDYFLLYPKSVFLVAYLLPYMKLLSRLQVELYSPAGWYSLVILNCLHILAAVTAGTLACKRFSGKASALLFLLLSLFFLPNYLNTYKVYSDTLSMPYVSFSILLLCIAHQTGRKKAPLIYALAGLSLAVGALLKASVLVLAIAAVVWELFGSRRAVFPKRLGRTALMLAVMFVVLSGWNARVARLPWLDQDERDRYELPYMHWIMMGSYGSGSYDQAALDYSMSFDSKELKAEMDTEMYRKNLARYGFFGYLRFLYQKTCLLLADGRYYQQGHMEILAHKTGTGALLSAAGKTYSYVVCYLLIFQCMIGMGFLAAALIAVKRGRADATFLFAVCMFGLILFFCFWEAKSRYLMDYTPMFLMNLALTIGDFLQARGGQVERILHEGVTSLMKRQIRL